MEKIVRGMIERKSRDFVITKCWMQDLFPDVNFMECDEGYYFEVPIDDKSFTSSRTFYQYLNKNISAATIDFYLCLITCCNVHLFETYLHFAVNWDNVTRGHFDDETVIATIRDWLKWDKLHTEYNK